MLEIHAKTIFSIAALNMAYAVSDIFNSTYVDLPGPMPETLLFERVWPPLLQEVPDRLKKTGTTTVSQETDCAYRCFHNDHCRGFSLHCIMPSKCNQFHCELLTPILIGAS